jgi:hypothetical protein
MIEIYIGTDRLDTFRDEDVNITLNVQNIQDISKVFADYTQNFSVPASRVNNDLFKHYYNADVSGGFDAALRQSAIITLNKETFREGSLELVAVNMQGDLPSSYEVVFYSAGVNLLDLFGEDQLTDLDLSAYDHDYTGANVRTGLESGLSSRNIIYPLISPKIHEVDGVTPQKWFYDSNSSSHSDYNLAYHTTNDDHGLHYYELKPAIRLARIIDAIESKYSITFNSEFFDSDEFINLYMWCHRREGFMFENQPTGFEQAQAVDFTSATGSGFDTTTDELTIPSTYDRFIWRYSATCTDDYQFHFYINDVFFTAVSHSGNVTDEEIYFNSLSTGDRIQMRYLPATTNTSITSVSASGREFLDPTNVYWTATASAGQTVTQEVIIADQMPEQKVSDFIIGLIKMFNLALEPTSTTAFTLEPLDDWYAEGNQYDITKHTDITTRKVSKPELYRRIKLEHQLADSQLMNAHRLTNGGVAYGDLRADFSFDGGELLNQTNFELLRFEKLVDTNTSTNVDFLIGSSIDKELKPYIGAPMIFYSPNTKDISSDPIGFLDETGLTPSPADPVEQINFIANVNSETITSVTRMLTFGLNIDPYHDQAFNETLYKGYWEDYITNLYSVSRRLYSFRAILPLEIISKLKMNDRLVWNGYRFIINQIQVNLRTREATLELLNDVGAYSNPTAFAELLDEQGNYLISEGGDYLIVE